MRERLRISVWIMVPLLAWASVLACGRSESVGWAARDLPDAAVERGQTRQAEAQQQAQQVETNAAQQEYQQLSRALVRLQMEAMADSALSRRWNALVADVDSRVVATSAFHRGLIERRAEIERLLEHSDTLTADQQAELARHYQNVQMEMARVRNEELRKPEFFGRLAGFQAALFDKMRELSPSQVELIDRLEEIETKQLVPAESGPPVPGMQPVR